MSTPASSKHSNKPSSADLSLNYIDVCCVYLSIVTRSLTPMSAACVYHSAFVARVQAQPHRVLIGVCHILFPTFLPVKTRHVETVILVLRNESS